MEAKIIIGILIVNQILLGYYAFLKRHLALKSIEKHLVAKIKSTIKNSSKPKAQVFIFLKQSELDFQKVKTIVN